MMGQGGGLRGRFGRGQEMAEGAGGNPASERERLMNRAAKLEQLLALTYDQLKVVEQEERTPESSADPFPESAQDPGSSAAAAGESESRRKG